MNGWRLRARRPRGEPRLPAISRDPDLISSFLHDAAHFSGGHAAGFAAPANEAELAVLLQQTAAILPIGAQSSLTGGATPMGEVVLSTRRLNRILEIGRDFVRVEAGVTIEELDAALEQAGRYYPPSPTFPGAAIGGTLATNAAGAATFKYGMTRDWVEAITVVLATGDVLDIERGRTCAHADGFFELELSDRIARVPIPSYAMPKVPKLSAGYYARARMDLADLFIGSEGTLGVVTEAMLRVRPIRPARCLVLVPFSDRDVALAFVRRMRDEAGKAWNSDGTRGIDVSAIEHMDARCLALVREDGIGRKYGLAIPENTALALLLTVELDPATTAAAAFDEIGQARNRDAPDTMLVRLCRALDAAGVVDVSEIAVPGDRQRFDQLVAVREAVPSGVNQRVARAKENDPRIEKTAGDFIVPFDALEELLAAFDDALQRRGLDVAVWGHISDGNLHPNVIPRSFADVAAGRETILEWGRLAIRLGGSPLAEHGVGRNRIKQQLLADLYGVEGIEEMRRTKRALDPKWKLGPGVLFSPSQA